MAMALGERELKLIAALGVRSINGPGRYFQNRMGRQAKRKAPRLHRPAQFTNFISTVEIDDIDWKLHAPGMHTLTGHNPQALTWFKGFSAE